MSGHNALTATTVLQAADNLFSQLKRIYEASNGHANSYAAYKTQEASLVALGSRLTSTPMRQRTQERVRESLNEAVKSMQQDLIEMQLVLSALESLPRSVITSSECDRLDYYTSSHSKELQRKQILLKAVKANVLDDPTSRNDWLAAWKDALTIQQTQSAELDALANAFGSW